MMEIIIIFILIVLFAVYVGSRTQSNKGTSAKRKHSEIDWDAVYQPDVLKELPHKKINAIKAYRRFTDAGLSESKEAIEYVIANWDNLDHVASQKKKAHRPAFDDSGIRDLIQDGDISQAIEVYRQFTGVDIFTAREEIENIQREMGIRLQGGSDVELSDLLQDTFDTQDEDQATTVD